MKSGGATVWAVLVGMALGLVVLGTVLDVGLRAFRLRRRQQALSAWWQTQRVLLYWTARDQNARFHVSSDDPVVRSLRTLRPGRLDDPGAPGVTLLSPDGRLSGILTDTVPVRPATWPVRFLGDSPPAEDLYVWAQPSQSPSGVLVRGRPVPPTGLDVRTVIGPADRPGVLPVGTRVLSVAWTAYEVEADGLRPGTYRLYRRHQGGRLRLADGLRDCRVESDRPLRVVLRCAFPVDPARNVDRPVILVFNDRLF